MKVHVKANTLPGSFPIHTHVEVRGARLAIDGTSTDKLVSKLVGLTFPLADPQYREKIFNALDFMGNAKIGKKLEDNFILDAYRACIKGIKKEKASSSNRRT